MALASPPRASSSSSRYHWRSLKRTSSTRGTCPGTLPEGRSGGKVAVLPSSLLLLLSFPAGAPAFLLCRLLPLLVLLLRLPRGSSQDGKKASASPAKPDGSGARPRARREATRQAAAPAATAQGSSKSRATDRRRRCRGAAGGGGGSPCGGGAPSDAAAASSPSSGGGDGGGGTRAKPSFSLSSSVDDAAPPPRLASARPTSSAATDPTTAPQNTTPGPAIAWEEAGARERKRWCRRNWVPARPRGAARASLNLAVNAECASLDVSD